MRQKADWRARWARRLMLSAWRPMRWQRLALFAAVSVALAALAMWAAWLKQEAASVPLSPVGRLFDLLYAPFTYLVPQATFALAHTLAWQEGVARILGPLLPLLGMVWLFRRRMLVGLARLLLAHGAQGHAVILGDRGSADRLAIASSEKGEPVLLCDPSAVGDEDRLAQLGAAGVVVLGAPPADLRHCSSIATWSNGDAENLAGAIALRGQGRIGERDLLFAQHSPDAHRALLQAPDLALDGQVRLRPISLAGDALRRALGQPGNLARALARGQRRVTLCLWGDGDGIAWAAEMALRQFWSVQLGAPHVYCVTEGSASQIETEGLSRFARHAPDVFAPQDLPRWQSLPRAEAERDRAVTLHLVDAGNDDETVAICFSLAGRLRQESSDPPPVKAILRGTGDLACLFRSEALHFLPPILLEERLAIDVLQDRGLDEAAAQLHLAYDREFGGGGTSPASGRWQELPETYVAANRAAADHIKIKAWDAQTSGFADEALVEALARIEHDRWCAERLLNGWIPAHDGQRDNRRRFHPDLRPWSALDEATREKDRAQVRAVISGAQV